MVSVRSLPLVAALVSSTFIVACSSESSSSGAGRSVGTGCDGDEQCTSGLTCRANYVGGQCTTQKTCTKTCGADADCQSLSAKAKCFQGCNSEKICMLTP